MQRIARSIGTALLIAAVAISLMGSQAAQPDATSGATLPPLPPPPGAGQSGPPASPDVGNRGAPIGTLPSGASLPRAETVPVVIPFGWSLFSLPVVPTAPINASALLASLLLAPGGHEAAIYGLTNGAWGPSLIAIVGGSPPNQSDFTL